MDRRRIYLDWNATAPLREAARAAMVAVLDSCGNPSSTHAEGQAARAAVERSRAAVAALVGCRPAQVVFMSGATEANVLALDPGLRVSGQARPLRLLVSALEHPSVLEGGRFAPEQVERTPARRDGRVDIEALAERIRATVRAGVTPFVALMAVNNETGVVQPLEQAAALVREAGGVLHVDAVQAAARIPLQFNALGADLMTLSSHKIGGPQGAGALIVSERVAVSPMIRGGRQERGARAGTENVAAIAGFGAAAASAAETFAADCARMAVLRGRLEAGLRAAAADTVIFGDSAPRVANTVLFAVPGTKAETALIALDLEGVAASSGAACSSGKVAPSHVLQAMGVAEALTRGAVRVSLGRDTGEEEVEGFLRAWRKHLEALPKRMQGIAA